MILSVSTNISKLQHLYQASRQFQLQLYVKLTPTVVSCNALFLKRNLKLTWFLGFIYDMIDKVIHYGRAVLELILYEG